MTARARTTILVLLSLIIIGGLAYVLWQTLFDGGEKDGGPSPAVEGGGPVTVVESAAFSGAGPDGDARLRIRLSSGQPQPDSVQDAPLAEGTPLSQAEIEDVLARLPALTPAAADVEAFRLPEELLPPPRTGETVDESFPPETGVDGTAEAPAGPLEVLRFSPEGQVPLAPFVSVTFNQPMVPLATVEELAAADVPVTITPSLSGVWKWVGTKTLTFEAAGGAVDRLPMTATGEAANRLPMATEFVVEVPAGTESATGSVLAESVTWRFQTPPPQIETAYPQDGPQPLEPLLFVAFDQRIDPAAVLESADVTAGGESYPLRLATDEEIAADETVSRLVEQAGEGRWLAFRTGRPFPADTGVDVTVGPGTPSGEGPLVTEQEQAFRFHTYPPLRVDGYRCGWSDDCPPYAPFIIDFSNPLDEEAFDQSLVEIDPPLPGATVRLAGGTITIEGATRGRTDYDVTIDGELRDIFGQTLGESRTLSFAVGSARPLLSGPNQNLVTVDPASTAPRFTVYSVNYERLRVRAYAVEPADWPTFTRYLEQYNRELETATPPGRELMDETIDVDAERDAMTETAIDLSEPLDGPSGHLVVIVEPPASLPSQDRDQRRPVVQAWVQVTRIALDAFADQDEMVVWATDLRDGAPLAGVTVELGGERATTEDDGTARLALTDGGAGFLVGRKDGDTAILPSNPYYWDESGWSARPVRDALRWYVFDDRQIYRPGEDVHLKGWLRRVGGGPAGDVSLAGDAVAAVRYTVIDPQGNELHTGEVDVSTLGGFDLSFTVPENANLGHATVHFSAGGDVGDLGGVENGHSFQIQEFRRPEFEVSARQETAGPYFVGESATVAVAASYYAGGPLPNAPVEWAVRSSPASYAPPNWPDFVFGVWTPWWLGPVFEDAGFYGGPEPFYGPGGDLSSTEIFTGFTDAAGEHYLELTFEEANKARPFSVRAEAAVLDVNRQAWAGSTNLLVHPADLYVGLRSERTFVERGQPLEIEAIVTDLDGNAVTGRTVEVRAARMEWRFSQGRWAEEEADAQTCTVESTDEPVTCTFATDEGGTYRITATVTDDQGRVNESSFTRWVSGGQRPSSRRVEQETITLIPDKEEYEPGDVAEILVQAPFSPAEGLLTVSRSGILYTESFRVTEGSYTLRVPIEEGHLPNLHVQVDLAGAAPRLDDAGELVPDAPPRPAYASGRLDLPISTRSRTLSVDVAPQESGLEPGGETVIDVAVADAGGQPMAGAEVAVVVVDEAILALTNYQLADPVEAFYLMRDAALRSTYGRALVTLARPESLVEVAGEAVEATRLTTDGAMVMPMAEAPAEAEEAMAADDGAAQEQAIRVRADFNPLAVFAPAVQTDSDGRAQVQVILPDNLTRYRIMAVAVTEREFGQGESNLTARLPLMVRPSAPRFLNFGDRFELPVVVQNQTGEEMTVDVVAQASNLELAEGAGRRVVVPANDRVEVRFPATTAQVGTARVQLAAVSGSHADAATVELPVYTPATTEAFATYGVVDEGAIVQPVAAPAGVIPQFGGLEVQTSSTALQALTDAVLYLVDYRYACSEQLASRILAVAALRDVLTAFEAEGLPEPAEMEEAVRQDIENLVGMQNGDGGFPIWVRGRESIPFYSIHVAHALQRARMKGFTVPEESLQRSLGYLREIESHYPAWYSEGTRHSLSAYALYVRRLMGDGDAAKAARLLDDAGLEELPLEAVAWLWAVLDDGGYAEQVDAIRRHLNNRAVETAGAANFTTSYGDQSYLMLHSNRRTDAVILDALIGGAPESDLIPKVVNGLLAHRTRGRWSNTQENVFVLLALDRYFNTFESQTPEFVARIWLGETYAGGHSYSGRSTERHETQIPMSYLLDTEQGTQDLILSKEGAGRLYYRLGLRYAPADLDLDPLDRGFVVERSYEAVDDPDDVYRDEAGVWHIRAGARVRVRLTMVAENRRYHVALEDPLPAGLEIVNPALAVAQSAPADPDVRPSGRWWHRWFEHQNLRDERAEAFTTLLWDGVYEYTYVARATTPGAFIAPPAKAEEMYSPEVFGRSGSDRVIVE